MARQFPLLSVNTTQIVSSLGALTGYHQLILFFATAPSAGTVVIEYQLVGTTAWVVLQHANGASVIPGFLNIRADGPISNFRITFTGLVGGAAPVLWIDTQGQPAGLFGGLAAIITQPYTEANVKNGLQFNLRAVWPLADVIPTGTARKIWFKTNAKPVIVKLREFQYVGEEMKIELFISPTGVSAGTDLTVHNYNGVSPVATTVQAKKNVTITGNGTPFDAGDPEHFFGGANDPQRQAASIPQGRERILPANTEFAVVITNTGTGNARAQYFLDWYEGGTDLPL